MPNFEVIPDRKKASIEELDFLMGQTRFLYRVFTDDCRSPLTSDGFIADKYRDNGSDLNVAQLLVNDDTRYLSGLQHIESQENSSSPWISTTRVWDWAMWRLRSPNEKMESARVAVIDLLHFPRLQLQLEGTSELSSDRFQGQIIHALGAIKRLELQNPSAPPFSKEMVQRARDRANSADEVLVYAMIPDSAVVSTFSLSDIWPSVPRNFVTDPIDPIEIEDNGDKQQIGRFRLKRDAWIKKLNKERWDTDKLGHKVTELAYSFLHERASQIGLTLSQLNSMLNLELESNQATSPQIESNNAHCETPDDVEGADSGNDRGASGGDDGGSISSTEDSIRLADVVGQARFYEMDAEAGSLDSLASARSRLTTASKYFSSQESLAAPIADPTGSTWLTDHSLLIDLSVLPTLDQESGSIGRSAEASQAIGLTLKKKSDSKTGEAQRSISIFCDQLLILSSSILEPYWNIKRRKDKDWDILKHAIAESVKLKVVSLENLTTRTGEEGINTGVILDKFEKSYPPYQWVISKPASKGRVRRAVEKVASKLR
ncbi:hypothetical protein RSAG8_13133, partial [Rhizoctonia solani AG-8 WAC10335]